MMRERYTRQLQQLQAEMTAMGNLCQSAIASAAKALKEKDAVLARHAIQIDEEIDQKEKDIEKLCLRLLLQQQPVAGDLRRISSALKMITDMERIGDQAADICEIVLLAKDNLTQTAAHIGQMAEATIFMVGDSIEAYVTQDLPKAQAVIDYDDVVDGLFDRVKEELLTHLCGTGEWHESIIDAVMIAKYLERIGDHAVNIAQWAEYSLTGVHRTTENQK